MSDSKENNAHQLALARIRAKTKLPTVDTFVAGICAGDIATLGRAVTLIESTLPTHQQLAQEVIQACLPFAGNSFRLGITGVPGVGKSTFIEHFGLTAVEQGKKVAVLAIDPSSRVTGGSILGDKTRMEHLAAHPDVFIRPSPSADSLGGVAQKTRESIVLCEAAGFDYILIETVGVGQSETEVKDMVDFFLLLMLSGAGDELQGIKRGIMEMADAICITKADGDNLQKAKVAGQQYKNALHLLPAADSNWTPRVKAISAYNPEDLAEVFAMLEKFREHTAVNGWFESNRKNQSALWFSKALENGWKQRLYSNPQLAKLLSEQKKLVIENKISPFAASEFILNTILHQLTKEK